MLAKFNPTRRSAMGIYLSGSMKPLVLLAGMTHVSAEVFMRLDFLSQVVLQARHQGKTQFIGF